MLSRGGVKILNEDDDDVVRFLEQRMKALPTPLTPESGDSHNVAVTNKKHPPDVESVLSNMQVSKYISNDLFVHFMCDIDKVCCTVVIEI